MTSLTCIDHGQMASWIETNNVSCSLLAFIWPKADRSHTYRRLWHLCSRAFGVAFLDGPASKATGHAPRPVHDWLMRSVCARPLHSLAFVASADFLTVGHFAPFSQLLHIKGRNFPDVFPVHDCLWRLWTMKSFMEIGLHFLRNLEDRRHTHTCRQTWKLYIYRRLDWYLLSHDMQHCL